MNIKNKYHYILYAVFLISFPNYAQNDAKYIDSLISYASKPDDSLKFMAMSELTWEFNNTDVDKAIQYAQIGLKTAENIQSRFGIAQAYTDLGIAYYFKRDFDSSEYFYFKAAPVMKSIRDTSGLAFLYNNMGALYKERAEYDVSLKYSFESLRIYQWLDNKRKIALLLNNIGVTYEELKKYDTALDYYHRALNYNIAEENENGIARNYIGLGNMSLALKNYAEAMHFFRLAEPLFRKLEWTIELSVVLNNMGNVYAEQKQYGEALKKKEEALKIAIESEDIQGQAKYHLYITDILFRLNRFREAEEHIEKANILAKKIKSYEIEMDLYEAYAKYYFGTNRFEKGNAYFLQFQTIKDSIYSLEMAKDIALMEVKHNTQRLRLEKAESDAKNLQLQNAHLESTQQRNYLIIAFTAFIPLLVLFLFYRSREQKRKEEKLRISAMLMSEEQERTRIARELHDGLGQILSTARLNAAALEDSVAPEDEKILQNALALLDQSVVEVRNISHNLMPAALSGKGLKEALTELSEKMNTIKKPALQFEYISHSAKAMEKSVEVAVYRVIQETLNNMVKHASADFIFLQIKQSDKKLEILIRDNGKGFDVKNVDESLGLGWKNISTRLSLIHGKFDIQSEIGMGTIINMWVAL